MANVDSINTINEVHNDRSRPKRTRHSIYQSLNENQIAQSVNESLAEEAPSRTHVPQIREVPNTYLNSLIMRGTDNSNGENEQQQTPSISNQATKLYEMLANKDYHDVILIDADGTEITTHRCILATCSSVFCDMFKDNNTVLPIRILLDNVDAGTIQAALDYMLGKHDSIKGKELRLFEFATAFCIYDLMAACSSAVDYSDIGEYDDPESPPAKKMRGKNAKYEFLEVAESLEDLKQRASSAKLKCKEKRGEHIYFICKTDGCSYRWKATVTEDMKYNINRTECDHNHVDGEDDRKNGMPKQVKKLIDKLLLENERVNPASVLTALQKEIPDVPKPNIDQIRNYIRYRKKKPELSEDICYDDAESSSPVVDIMDVCSSSVDYPNIFEYDAVEAPPTKKKRGKNAVYAFLEVAESLKDLKQRATTAGLKFKEKSGEHVYYICRTAGCSYRWKATVTEDLKYNIHRTECDHDHNHDKDDRKNGMPKQIKEFIDKLLLEYERVNPGTVLTALQKEMPDVPKPSVDQIRNYVKYYKKKHEVREDSNEEDEQPQTSSNYYVNVESSSPVVDIMDVCSYSVDYPNISEYFAVKVPPANASAKKMRGKNAKYEFLEVAESLEDLKQRASIAGLKCKEKRGEHVYFICKTDGCSYRWKATITEDMKYNINRTECDHNHVDAEDDRKNGMSKQVKKFINDLLLENERVTPGIVLTALQNEMPDEPKPTVDQLKNYIYYRKKKLEVNGDICYNVERMVQEIQAVDDYQIFLPN